MKRFILYISLIFFSISANAQSTIIRDANLIRNYQLSATNPNLNSFTSISPYFITDYQEIYPDSIIKQLKYGFRPYTIYMLEYMQDFSNFKQINGILALGAGLNYSKSNKLGISYEFIGYLLELPEFMISEKWNTRLYKNIGLATRVNDNIILKQDLHIIYSPYSFMNIDLAFSRNFIGDGYRSLLLSDFSSSYPYLKIETKFLNLKYSCIWAVNSNLINDDIDVLKFSYKFSAFHYLDIKLAKFLNVGIFEGVIVEDQKFFSFEYLNPFLFFNPIEFSRGSNDNNILGANFKLIVKKGLAVHGQVVFDNFILAEMYRDIKYSFNKSANERYGYFDNKWGAQLGLKAYNAFNVNSLDLFVEFNVLRPYVYSSSKPHLNYSHSGLALAHPLGANFIETISGAAYKHNDFLFDLKLMFAHIGIDTIASEHYGQDIFKITTDKISLDLPYSIHPYGNYISQGHKQNLLCSQLEFGYVYGKNIISLGFASRFSLSPNKNIFFNMLYIGFKSNMGGRQTLY